jgi:hypothetical protein
MSGLVVSAGVSIFTLVPHLSSIGAEWLPSIQKSTKKKLLASSLTKNRKVNNSNEIDHTKTVK